MKSLLIKLKKNYTGIKLLETLIRKQKILNNRAELIEFIGML